jgi:hypothetical protein
MKSANDYKQYLICEQTAQSFDPNQVKDKTHVIEFKALTDAQSLIQRLKRLIDIKDLELNDAYKCIDNLSYRVTTTNKQTIKQN